MKTIELTKTNAIKAVGSTVFDANYGDVKPGFTGDLALLLSGAKLIVRNAHQRRRTIFLFRVTPLTGRTWRPIYI